MPGWALGAVALGLVFFLSQVSIVPLSASAAGPGRLPDSPSSPAAPAPGGRLIFSAGTGETWSIYSADAAGGAWQRLTSASIQARDPAIAPDGKTLAFRSHRDGYWDIYVQAAGSSLSTRLTRGMVYSGAPSWSPDGRRIAFESYARGDLDIWVMNADGTQPIDWTPDSQAQDYGPAWSPDGKWIAFTSWRTGTQQVFVVPANPDCSAMGCRKSINLSQNKFDEQEPAWSPDGQKLAFVSDRDGQRAIYVADFSSPGLKNVRRLTFSGWDDHPAWSPDGRWVAFVSLRPTRQPVYVIPSEGGMPRALDDGPMFAGSVAWSSASSIGGDPVEDPRAPLPTPAPDLSAVGSGHPFEMRRMTSTRLDPGINRLNDRVADSFISLQARIKQEVGYDFMSVLSEMTRPLDLRCDVTCDTLSWHKAGRAFDSRLDYSDARVSNGLEVVREDQLGETYWRMFLRAAAQDGSLGEPMKEAPWDFSYRARWIVGPGDGGMKKPVPYGFYVDFTELAREYGWERISSHEEDDFDWKTNKIAAEYWHYQRMQGLNWYQAMREVYSEGDLKSLAEWNTLATQFGYDGMTLFLKGVPAPAKAWRWYVLGP